MLNSMLSPFKKMKSDTDIVATQKKNEQKNQQNQCYSIVYQNPMTLEKDVLYSVPKVLLNKDEALFHPQQWNIRRFQIGRPLGRGKFGHVYLARQRATKHIVAIKVLTMKQVINSQVIGQIRRQIQIHTHLNHPNILKMYGFFFDQKRIYYIMQYAAGGELYKELKLNEKFPENRVARYITQMIGALMHIHKCKVFHRDIKPENILVCTGDQLKISDFGWSVRALTTHRKTMCGTLDYLCPQIIQNKFYDWSVDIWALGVLTYELSTGNAPFACKERQKQYKNIRDVNIKYPFELSELIVDFIGKLLQKNPANRMKLQEALQHPWLKKYNQ